MSSHQKRAASATEKSQRVRDQLSGPQLLDPNRLRWQQAQPLPMYPQAALNVGRWVRPNPMDTTMAVRTELLKGPDGKLSATGATPFGVMHTTERDIEYLQQKKEEIEYAQLLASASHLVDDRNPESRERAISLFPELESYPEEWHMGNLQAQERLRVLLRDGVITERDDHLLIMQMMNDDYILPVFPLWDSQGLLSSQMIKEPEIKKLAAQNVRRGLFNPVRFGTAADAGGNEVLQRSVKRMILRTLYAGLRDKDDEYVNNFIARMNPITRTKPDDNALMTPDYMRSIPYDGTEGVLGTKYPKA